MRYKVHGAWLAEQETGYSAQFGVGVEVADCIDTRTGTVYREGAFRVLVDGKPVKGKGGTHPFMGETAWMDAERLASDICVERRYR